MILDKFLFLDGESTVAESNAWRIPADATQLDVQIGRVGSGSEEINVTVQGKIDLVGDAWADLGVVVLSDLTVETAITQVGAVIVPICGVREVRVVNNGTVGKVRVFANATN